MTADKLEQIRDRVKNGHCLREDLEALLNMVDDLQNKNRILSAHAMELNQEIENIKADFGGDAR